MDLDHIVDQVFHAGQAHPFAGQFPPAHGRLGSPDIQHDPGLCFRNILQIQVLCFKFQFSGIHIPLVSFGTGGRHFLVLPEDLSGILCAHNGGDSQLAADNGGMGGAAPLISDNGCSTLHDRHPVRIGHGGYQHGTVLEMIDLRGTLYHTDLSCGNGLTDTQTGDQTLSRILCERICLHGSQCFPGLHGFRSGLHNEQISLLTVLGPFDIHRGIIMFFDLHAPAGKLHDLAVRQHKVFTFFFGSIQVFGGLGFGIHHFLFLGTAGFFNDRIDAFIFQKWLENRVLIRVDRPLNHIFTKSPGRIDQNRIRKPGIRVQGKQYPGTGQIGTDHFLNTYGECHLQVVKSLFFPVGNGPVREQRGHAIFACRKQSLCSGDIQKRFLLPGKTGLWHILGRGAGPGRHVHIFCIVPFGKVFISRRDCLCNIFRHFSLLEQIPDGLPCFLQRCLFLLIGFEQFCDLILQLIFFDECPIGCCGRGKAVRNKYILVFKGPDHLSQRCILATYQADIF